MSQWDDRCEWTTASGICEEPVFYELTYVNESNALVEGAYCFHHAHELARDGRHKIYVVKKIEKDE